MRSKRRTVQSSAKRLAAVILAVMTAAGPLSQAQEKAVEPASVSTGTAQPQTAPEAAGLTGDKQLYAAITDLNYKIEYLQAGYNRLSADIEAMKIADRDQKKAFNDRISAMPLPDMSKIDNLETESALMRSEISQIRADIAAIKGKLDYRGQPAEKRGSGDKLLNSPWIAVAALGLSIIAVLKR